MMTIFFKKNRWLLVTIEQIKEDYAGTNDKTLSDKDRG